MAARRRPTIVDVAREAGVSRQTVSNVVNGRHELMGPATRGRVERAMRELGYHRNEAARSLRSARTHTLGFLLVDEGPGFLADPMTDLLLAGIGDVLREHRYGLLIQSARPGAPADDLLAPLLEGRADGALLLLSGRPEDRHGLVATVAGLGLAAMVLGERPGGPAPVAAAADRAGARGLAEHLLRAGHRRIGFAAAGMAWPMIEERQAGYREALAAAGMTPDPTLERFAGEWQAASGAALATALLDAPEPPTAIMAGNDLLAAGVLREAAARGLRVPDDLAVTGYDDFAFAEFLQPALTTVRVPAYDLGRRAAEALLAQVEDGVPARSFELPVEVVVRASA
jgi:DNA-binding LacI/PurR family transcriptional regulator